MGKPKKKEGAVEGSFEALKQRVVELEKLETRQEDIEAQLRQSELRYRFLYEENPSMYFTVDTSGVVLSVNPYGATQLGHTVSELLGRSVLDVFHPDDRESVKRQLATCADFPGEQFSWELRKIHRDGRVLWVREVARAVRDTEDRTVVLIVCEDITARRSVEAELRAAHDDMERRVRERTAEVERQRRFLRQVIDVDPNFIFAKDHEGRFTLVNQALADAYGTNVEKLTGKRDADFNPNQAEVDYFRQIDLEVMRTCEERFIPEEQITDSKGKLRWLQTVKRVLKDEDGRPTMVLGSATDITARREAEDKLRLSEAALRQSQEELRQLAGRLLTAQEDERRSIAREMHDDLGQRLASIAWQVGRLERLRTMNTNEASELIGSIRASLKQLSTDVRSLSKRLHPAILSDLGLVDALRAECNAITEQGHLIVQFESRNVPAEVDKNVAIVLYRISQEALRNVAKHAKTDRARVRLEGNPTELTLEIEDGGVGFDAASRRGVGLGLASMSERARLIEGQISIESRLGHGSLVRVTVPLAPRQSIRAS